MESDEIVNYILDYDSYINGLLDDVSVEENQHAPPMYNVLKNFHTLLRTNIHTVLNDTRVTEQHSSNAVIPLDQFHLKIHNMIIHKTHECPICLEEIPEKSVCSMLPCFHSFHERCIKRWLVMNNSSCPVCRTKI